MDSVNFLGLYSLICVSPQNLAKFSIMDLSVRFNLIEYLDMFPSVANQPNQYCTSGSKRFKKGLTFTKARTSVKFFIFILFSLNIRLITSLETLFF